MELVHLGGKCLLCESGLYLKRIKICEIWRPEHMRREREKLRKRKPNTEGGDFETKPESRRIISSKKYSHAATVPLRCWTPWLG